MFKRDSIRLVNLKKLAGAGIYIAAGTDVGSLGDMPAASYLPELLKMKQSGMSNWQIIRAATIIPTFFINKQNSLWTITTVKIADLFLLNKNPVDELENLNDIAFVFKNGVAIFPDTLLNETPEMTVQRLWNAYNAKNSEAFLACLSPNIKMYNPVDSQLHKGLKEIMTTYSRQLQKASNTHCEIKSRMAAGNTVVDKLLIKEADNVTNEQIIAYTIHNHKITSIFFIKWFVGLGVFNWTNAPQPRGFANIPAEEQVLNQRILLNNCNKFKQKECK